MATGAAWSSALGSAAAHPVAKWTTSSAGDNHDVSNLQTLCTYCHARKTAGEAAQARRPRPSRTRKPESHPGSL
ncbi:HNH endonuclease signature motif containing protein [Micromonospora sp. NPDC048986]|uniref:HNH endonuclease signature motif containing protein n=1 Tax=Micromonospora sp. NPDC048986 TaxID=3155644 RepID=UPI0033F1F237